VYSKHNVLRKNNTHSVNGCISRLCNRVTGSRLGHIQKLDLCCNFGGPVRVSLFCHGPKKDHLSDSSTAAFALFKRSYSVHQTPEHLAKVGAGMPWTRVRRTEYGVYNTYHHTIEFDLVTPYPLKIGSPGRRQPSLGSPSVGPVASRVGATNGSAPPGALFMIPGEWALQSHPALHAAEY
jgi:hypothetical protein